MNKQEDDYDSSDDEAKDTLTEDDIALMKEVERIADDKAKRIAKEQRTKREAAQRPSRSFNIQVDDVSGGNLKCGGKNDFNSYYVIDATVPSTTTTGSWIGMFVFKPNTSSTQWEPFFQREGNNFSESEKKQIKQEMESKFRTYYPKCAEHFFRS